MAGQTDLHATKRRLLDAAGPVFAAAGFEGASLRAISAKARANLAAVKYHFGGKAELYEAVLHEAGTYAKERHPFPDDAVGTPASKLTSLVLCIMRRVLDRGRPAWHARLMSREMADPSPSFHLIAEHMAKPLVARITAAVAELMPGADADAVRAHAHSIIGQCLFYRHAAPLLRHLQPGADPADRIEAIAAHIARFSLTAITRRGDVP